MSAIYLPANNYITVYDYRLQFDLTTGTMQMDLGPSVIRDPTGVTVSVKIKRPDNAVIDVGTVFSAVNISAVWSWNFPKVQSIYMWGLYTVDATLTIANNGGQYMLEKRFNMCAPDSSNPYALEMTGTITVTVDCNLGTLTASGLCGYAYRGVQPMSEAYNLVRYYPPEAELLPQKNLSVLPFVVDAYQGLNTIKGVNTSTYDFGDNVFAILRITASTDKNVRCGLDMDSIFCGLKALFDQLIACNASQADFCNAFGEIDALLWLITYGLNENRDMDDYIDRLEKLIGVECHNQACAGTKVGPKVVPDCPQPTGATGVIIGGSVGSTLQQAWTGNPHLYQWAGTLKGIPVSTDRIELGWVADYLLSQNLDHQNITQTTNSFSVEYTGTPAVDDKTFLSVSLDNAGVPINFSVASTAGNGSTLLSMVSYMATTLLQQAHITAAMATQLSPTGPVVKLNFTADLPIAACNVLTTKVMRGYYSVTGHNTIATILADLQTHIIPSANYTDTSGNAGLTITGLSQGAGAWYLYVTPSDTNTLNIAFNTGNMAAGSQVHVEYRPFCDPTTNAAWVDGGYINVTDKAMQLTRTYVIPSAENYQVRLTPVMADGSTCDPVIYTVAGTCAEIIGANTVTGVATDFPQADWGWSDTIMDIGNPGAFPWQRHSSFERGDDISTDYTGAPLDNIFVAVRYPKSEPTKTQWINTQLNQGTIPDNIYDSYEDDNYKYAYSRLNISLDSNNQFIVYT